tara:strand:+ start:380 stop:994 length:615 start_codon:yes stop_codon:yes gene_type:complete
LSNNRCLPSLENGALNQLMTNLASAAFPTHFETEHLLIRRYRLDDDEMLYNAARASSAEIYPFLPWCHPDYSMRDTHAWLAQVKPAWQVGTLSLAIFEKTGGRFLGGIGLSPIDEHPSANLGYWIRSDATRRGVATEATIGLARFGFAHLGLQRIEIIMSVRNTASRRVAEKAGGRLEGTLRNRLFLHGKAHDAYCFSLVPGEL